VARRNHWYKEIKFSSATQGVLPLYQQVVDIALDPGVSEFFCFVADRQAADPIGRFGNSWAAYGKLAEQLVVASTRQDELVSLLAARRT